MIRKFFHNGRLGDMVMALPLLRSIYELKSDGDELELLLMDGNAMVPGSANQMKYVMGNELHPGWKISVLNHETDFAEISLTLMDGNTTFIDLGQFRNYHMLHECHIIQSYFRYFNVPYQQYQSWAGKFFQSYKTTNTGSDNGYVIVNVTERYRTDFNWKDVLNMLNSKYPNRVYFVGTEKEYEAFKTEYQNQSFFLKNYTNWVNISELIQFVVNASEIYCNQSFVYTIALLSKTLMHVELAELTCAVPRSPHVQYVNKEGNYMADHPTREMQDF